jgi:hypothetical protein
MTRTRCAGNAHPAPPVRVSRSLRHGGGGVWLEGPASVLQRELADLATVGDEYLGRGATAACRGTRH